MPENPEQFDGVTHSERVLGDVARKTFLRLWSIPNPFRDQGPGSDGKEICDLLVVFGNTVVIFSDKTCDFPKVDDLGLAWRRWYKRAISKSVDQARGAKRWILQHPDRVYLDRKCTRHVPFGIPGEEDANFHLVVVASGAAQACLSHMGDLSSSLRLASNNWDLEPPAPAKDAPDSVPFVVTDQAGKGDYVHILNEDSLQIVLRTVDTIADFVAYLEAKRTLLESGRRLYIQGEENLLAIYMLNRSSPDNNKFGMSEDDGPIIVAHAAWAQTVDRTDYRRYLSENTKSYLWDSIIEDFAAHAVAGTLYWDNAGLTESEKLLRFLASFTRFHRRILAESLYEITTKAPAKQDRRRTMLAPEDPEILFVFMGKDASRYTTHEEYRKARQAELLTYCHIQAYQFRNNVKQVCGIATESGLHEAGGSNDFVLFDQPKWTEEEVREVLEVQEQTGFAKKENMRFRFETSHEFPDAPGSTFRSAKKIGRNEPCPCGSGVKFKKCCGFGRH